MRARDRDDRSDLTASLEAVIGRATSITSTIRSNLATLGTPRLVPARPRRQRA